SDLPGLIFTYVWALDMQADWDYVQKISGIFESKGGVVYYVELEADVEERLERNKSPNRLLHKPTKRNIEFSEQDLLRSMDKYRLNSYEGEIRKENYIRINNTKLGAEKVAQLIKEKFQL
ncbi:MAG: shikimate kinase, partial [Paenibacillus sp.]|nr:shikimate kinase [Paenibacillus sp.]